jgi:hypothetical protein
LRRVNRRRRTLYQRRRSSSDPIGLAVGLIDRSIGGTDRLCRQHLMRQAVVRHEPVPHTPATGSSAQAHAVLSADHGCIAFAFPFSVDAQLQWLPTYAAQRTGTFSHSVPCAYRTRNAVVRCTVLLRLIPWCTQHFDRTVTAHRLLVPRAAPPRVHSYAVVRWPGRSDDGRLPPAALRYILRRVPSCNERCSKWRDLGGRERTLIIDQATRLLELFARETE